MKKSIQLLSALLSCISISAVAQAWDSPTYNSANTGTKYTAGQVGIGGSIPTGVSKKLYVNGEFQFDAGVNNGIGRFIFNRTTASTTEVLLSFNTGGTYKWLLGMDNEVGDDFRVFRGGSSHVLTINQSTGNLLLGGTGTSAPTERLQVDNGNILVSTGNMTVKGSGGFSANGQSAYVYLGDQNNFIRSTFGTGVQIGVYGESEPVATFYSASGNGKVAIGTPSQFNSLPGTYKLFVQSGILTEEVKVALYNTSSWSDFVFDKGYKLKKLSDVESFIKNNKHLPDVPSAQEIVNEGLSLAKMDATLLQKIEELTLYIIEMDKKITTLQDENKELKNQLKK